MFAPSSVHFSGLLFCVKDVVLLERRVIVIRESFL